jgi:fatty-acyl-CoA synthase
MKIDFSLVSENLAHTYGDAECIVNLERNRRYTYRQFHAVTNQVINMMRERLRLRKGQVVATILNNDSACLLSFFTACKGETIFAYTNVVDCVDDQARQMDFLKPKVVFVEAALLPTHYAMLAERGIRVVSMDPPGPDFPTVLHFWDLMEGVSDANPNVIRDDRKDCVVLRFTGGTTGAAKAVMYSIDNWMASKGSQFAMPDQVIHRGTRYLHFTLITHSSGIMLFPVLYRGGCNLTMNERNLFAWCQYVEKERATASAMMPPALYHLLDTRQADAFDLSSLEVVFYGGLPMVPSRVPQLQKRFGNIFVQFYAASESPAMSTVLSMQDHHPLADGSVEHLASAGKITPGNQLKICDKDGNRVPVGSHGEIWHKSPALSCGYWKNPEKTAQEFCDGYWKSGDVGRMDRNGYVYVVDRVKDTFVSAGHTIYPSPTEAVICTHPKVRVAAVVGVPDAGKGQAVYAEVVPFDGERLTQSELKQFLSASLPTHSIPTTIRVVKQIPLSPVGKPLRRAVRENYLERTSA